MFEILSMVQRTQLLSPETLGVERGLCHLPPLCPEARPFLSLVSHLHVKQNHHRTNVVIRTEFTDTNEIWETNVLKPAT